MSELEPAVEAPASGTVIYTMGFDRDMVQEAMAQAGGNEQLAMNLVLNGEVHVALTVSSSTASISAPSLCIGGPTSSALTTGFGTDFAPSAGSSSSVSSIVLSFIDRLTGRHMSLALVADGKLQSRDQLYADIMHPLELMQAAAWFSARESSGVQNQHREEPPMPLSYMLTEFSPCVPVRVMCGCVATACHRLAAAPADMRVFYRTAGRVAGWIVDRVTRGRVRRVQVLLLRRAICAVLCACRAAACVLPVFDACCSKRWLVLRCVAAHRSVCIKPATAFILVCRLLLPPALQAEQA
jgi:hypothetical protein